MFRLEDLHFKFLHFRCDAILGRIAEDQALFYGTVQCVVEHQVQAADGGAAETRIAVPAFAVGATALHQLLVELLQIVGGQLGELDAADTGDGVLLDHQAVAICRGSTDIWLGVDVVPAPQPCGHGILICAADIDALAGFHGGGQLCFALRLGLAQDIFDDALAGFGVVASGVATLPPAVFALADVALAVCAFLGHGISSFAFVSLPLSTEGRTPVLPVQRQNCRPPWGCLRTGGQNAPRGP